jgi:LruC domain-containing protein
MKKFTLILITAFLAFSCVKMPNNNPDGPDPVENAIPDNFNWETIKEIDLTVDVKATTAGPNANHIISIYTSELLNSGSLIAKGVAKPNAPYNVKLSMAIPTDKLYIHEKRPDGTTKLTTQEINSSALSVSLSGDDSAIMTRSGASPSASGLMYPAPSITVPTQYDYEIADNSNLNLTGFNTGETSSFGNQYKSYLIPEGFNRTASINTSNWLAHSMLFVEGSFNVNSSISLNKSSIVILSGGSVNIRSLSTGTFDDGIPPVIYIMEGGSLTINQGANLSNNITIVNKGTFTIANSLEVTMGSDIYNEGTIVVTKKNNGVEITNNSGMYNSGSITAPNVDLTVSSTLVNDQSGIIDIETWYQSNSTLFHNHGELSASVLFSNSGGGEVYNHCKITAEETDVQALTVYLETGSLWNTLNLKANMSTFNMSAGSIFITKDIASPWDLTFTSSAELFSLLKVTGDVPELTHTSTNISGNIEFVHVNLTEGSGANGRDLYTSSLSNGAILNAEQTKNIPGTSCNMSLGQIEPSDPPEEPQEEFASYFPSESGWATYAFEDLWPYQGDYDMNDLVLKFRVTFNSNSSNEVTGLILDYKIVASGAQSHIGAAVQLDNVAASTIESVTGQLLGGRELFTVSSSGTETGVTEAVIPLFNDVSVASGTGGAIFNTFKDIPEINTENEQIVVAFNTPVAQSQMTMDSFNFFISVNTRGYEVHLPSYLPTSRFNVELARVASLHSSDYFKYQDGMMWGLMIPEAFYYPVENSSITEAYNYFTSWATSGGTENEDWYIDNPENINEEYIYR